MTARSAGRLWMLRSCFSLASLLDQMDIHSANNVAALQKHLSAEHSSIRDKFTCWLIPKAKNLLVNLGS